MICGRESGMIHPQDRISQIINYMPSRRARNQLKFMHFLSVTFGTNPTGRPYAR